MLPLIFAKMFWRNFDAIFSKFRKIIFTIFHVISRNKFKFRSYFLFREINKIYFCIHPN
jgi:hypothetical protein